MLFALLPFTTWAADITDVVITFNPNATSGPYTGTNSALPAVTVTGTVGGAENTDLLAGSTPYATAAFTADATVTDNTASMTNYTPGTYVLTVAPTTGNEVTDASVLTKQFIITNAAINVTTAPVLNDPIYTTATPPVFTGNYGVTYDGQAHQVIATGAQASVASGITGNLTYYYTVNAADAGTPSATEDIWYTELTAAQLAVTNAGDYKAWYRIEHNNIYVDNKAATEIGVYSVAKAIPTITTAPTAKNLTYNAAEQDLINTGTANGGVMVYALDGAGYGATNESPKAMNYKEGGYTVKYKILGDANHEDYEPTWGNGANQTKPITVTIAKKLLKVKPVAINTFFGKVKDEDDVALSYDGFVGNDWYKNDDNYNPAKVSVFTGGYTAPVGKYSSTITNANKTTLSDTKKYFNVDTYTNGLVAANGATPASALNYEIVLQSNDMVITPAAVKIDLKHAPAAAVYGTDEAAVTSWPVMYADRDTYLDVKIQTGGTSDAPTYGDATSDDLDKYLVTTQNGNQVATKKFLGMTISRANTSANPGSYALTLSGSTATSNTTIAAETVTDANVVFTVNSAKITITPENAWKVYGDAEPEQLTYKVKMTVGGADYELNDDQTEVVDAAISRVQGENVGDYKISIDESVKQNANFANGYELTLNNGWFTVEKANLVITALPQTLYIGDTAAKLGKVRGTNFTVTGEKRSDVVNATLEFGTSDDADQDGQLRNAVTLNNKKLVAHVPYAHGIVIKLNNRADLIANYNLVLNSGLLTVLDPAANVVLNATLDNTDAIAEAAGHKVNLTVTGRTLNADAWNVMVLPFKMSTYDFINDLGCYAVFNTLKSASGADVKFGLELTELKANEPFLVKPQAAITTDMVFNGGDDTGVTIVNVTPSKTVGSATFVGTYAPISPLVAQDGMYVPQGGKFVPYTTTYPESVFPATMAYLLVNATGEARITVEEADGSTTAISNISADGVAMKADGWYTVNGVKLQGMPTEKGIYINNGKKVVIK